MTQQPQASAPTTALTYQVRRAEEEDLPRLIEFHGRHVTTYPAAERYDWLYRNNPQGAAYTWLAVDPSDRICGWTAIFARDLSVNGQRVKAGVGCDAYVFPEFRRQGIAEALHAAALKAMRERQVPIALMFGPPVPQNLRALVRAGSVVIGGIQYVTAPLSARGLTSLMGAYTRFPIAHLSDTPAAYVVDVVLRAMRECLGPNDREFSVRPIERPTSAFDALFDEFAARVRVLGRSDAAVLEWRYVKNPVCKQPLVAIEHKDRLVGWAALEFAPKGCLLVDHLVPLDLKQGRRALAALVKWVAAQGADRLSLRLNPQGPYRTHFLTLGFVPGRSRERVQVLTGDPDAPAPSHLGDWHITSGDLNPESTPWSVANPASDLS